MTNLIKTAVAGIVAGVLIVTLLSILGPMAVSTHLWIAVVGAFVGSVMLGGLVGLGVYKALKGE